MDLARLSDVWGDTQLSAHVRGQLEPNRAVAAIDPDADEQTRHLGLPAALLTRDDSGLQRGLQKPGTLGPSKWNSPVACGLIKCADHRTQPNLLYSR